jgi:glyoxylase-like metal-dependent hydrolase (beta-lactamase superfamily II)
MSQIEFDMFTGGIADTNGYFFQAPHGVIAVDAPEDFAMYLREKGVRPAALLLTHAHWDHVTDAAALVSDNGCRVYAYERSTPESRLENWLNQSMNLDWRVPEYPVDVFVKDGDVLDVLGLPVQISHVPGHSLDSVTFYLPTLGAIFTGDTLMNQGMGRCDFPGGNEALLLEGIELKILSLPPETHLFAGHGAPGTLAPQARYLQSLRQSC